MPLSSFSPRTLRILLGTVLLFCFCRTVYTSRHLHVNDQQDFYVYDTAATLVRQGLSAHMYDGANTGADPQLRMIAPDTTFAHTAAGLGLPFVRMYVYPPILADMLVPLGGMPAYRAGYVWLGCQLAMLVAVAVLALRLAGLRWRSRGGLALLLGLVSLFSVMDALEVGQITLLLLLLWMLSMDCLQRDHIWLSAFALALASAVKLTPLIALLPLLLWRNWRWLRAFAVWALLLVVIMAVVNSPSVLADYVGHVMPAMSRGIPHPGNRSISSALQMIYLTRHGETMEQFDRAKAGPVPAALLLLGKLLPLLCLLAATAWVALRLRYANRSQQVQVLAAFAVLSVVVSPVSWVHAYVVAFPLLFLLWQAAFAQRTTRLQTVLLVLISLDLGGFLVNDLGRLALHSGDRAAAYISPLGPLSALMAVFLGLQVAASLPGLKPQNGATWSSVLPEQSSG